MRRFCIASILSLAALLFFIPAQVRADGMDNFTFTETGTALGDVSISWSLPATPDPTDPNFIALTGQGFIVNNVLTTFTVAGSTSQGPDLFNFNFASFDVEFLTLGNFGLSGVPTLFSGSESNPTFIPGVYNGVDPFNFDVAGAPNSATLTINAPEPSSLLMLFMGLLVVAGALTVKKAAA
ncbi:MAG TPA: PEP-CTERM sorting domain-containing protein [Dongiaceae bacterium]|nr:PEP-CTERM sorting domain-containing protein [Dongiaceae bacterium]